jgi:hypothetical protein
MASFLALSGTNFHAGLNKLGFVLQFLLFSRLSLVTVPLAAVAALRSLR